MTKDPSDIFRDVVDINTFHCLTPKLTVTAELAMYAIVLVDVELPPSAALSLGLDFAACEDSGQSCWFPVDKAC